MEKKNMKQSTTMINSVSNLIDEYKNQNTSFNSKNCAAHLINNNVFTSPIGIGDEVFIVVRYYGKPIYVDKDYVQTIGFSRNNIKIYTRKHRNFGAYFIWGKNAFATKEEARAVHK